MRRFFPSKKLLLRGVIRVENVAHNGEVFIGFAGVKHVVIGPDQRGTIYLRTSKITKIIPWEVDLT